MSVRVVVMSDRLVEYVLVVATSVVLAGISACVVVTRTVSW